MNNNHFIDKKIKLLTFIWMFFIIELVVFFTVTFFVLVPKVLIRSTDPSDVSFLYLSYILSIASIPAVFKIYDLYRKKVKKGADEKSRIETYQLAVIIKFAILELAAIFALIAFYLNESNEPLYMFAIVFVAIFLNKPSYSQFEKDYLKDVDENAIEEIV